MDFLVSRTSIWDKDVQPCGGAVLKKCVRQDKRNVDDIMKIPYYMRTGEEKAKADWYGMGENHRIENGCITRDFDDCRYFIKINTIKDLVKFISEHGDCVVGISDVLDSGNTNNPHRSSLW